MMRSSREHRARVVLGAILGIFAVLLCWYLILTSVPPVTKGVASVAARYFVAHCGASEDRALCYEKNVPKLLYVLPLENVFTVVRQILAQDHSYRFCHVLGHELGVWEVVRNPDHWMDLMHRNPPDILCSNGYIHGVIVGKFHYAELPKEQIDAIVPQLAGACESAPGWTPSSLDKAMCYHGMGHVLTFITGAKLDLAVSYCSQIAIHGKEDYTDVCTSGVFMQIFQPLEPEDYALIERLPVKPTKETLPSFCGAFDTESKRSNCYSEGWPLFRDELQSASGIRAFCGQSKEARVQDACYRTVTAIGARGSINNPDKQIAVCKGLSSARAQQCINALANAFIEEDRTKSGDAVSVCVKAGSGYEDACIGNLLNLKRFNFVEGSAYADAFCAAMPDSYKDRCAAM